MSEDQEGVEEPIETALKKAINAAEEHLEDDGSTEDGSQPEEQTDLAAMVEALEGLLTMAFAMLAERRSQIWAISKAEARGIAQPLAEIINRSGFGIDSPEARLAVAAGVVIVPRWLAEKRLAIADEPGH